jgi:hypothetical protein
MCDKPNHNKRRQNTNDPKPPAPQDKPTPSEPDNKTTEQKVAQLENRISRYERGMLRWTRAVAAAAGVSAVLTLIYVYSFIESERAYLLVTEARFGNYQVDVPWRLM